MAVKLFLALLLLSGIALGQSVSVDGDVWSTRGGGIPPALAETDPIFTAVSPRYVQTNFNGTIEVDGVILPKNAGSTLGSPSQPWSIFIAESSAKYVDSNGTVIATISATNGLLNFTVPGVLLGNSQNISIQQEDVPDGYGQLLFGCNNMRFGGQSNDTVRFVNEGGETIRIGAGLIRCGNSDNFRIEETAEGIVIGGETNIIIDTGDGVVEFTQPPVIRPPPPGYTYTSNTITTYGVVTNAISESIEETTLCDVLTNGNSACGNEIIGLFTPLNNTADNDNAMNYQAHMQDIQRLQGRIDTNSMDIGWLEDNLCNCDYFICDILSNSDRLQGGTNDGRVSLCNYELFDLDPATVESGAVTLGQLNEGLTNVYTFVDENYVHNLLSNVSEDNRTLTAAGEGSASLAWGSRWLYVGEAKWQYNNMAVGDAADEILTWKAMTNAWVSGPLNPGLSAVLGVNNDAGNYKITGLADGEAEQDAVTVSQLDTATYKAYGSIYRNGTNATHTITNTYLSFNAWSTGVLINVQVDGNDNGLVVNTAYHEYHLDGGFTINATGDVYCAVLVDGDTVVPGSERVIRVKDTTDIHAFSTSGLVLIDGLNETIEPVFKYIGVSESANIQIPYGTFWVRRQ